MMSTRLKIRQKVLGVAITYRLFLGPSVDNIFKAHQQQSTY